MITGLYVPGDRPDRIQRALISGADVVLVDLEDAVAPAHKAAARDGLVSLVGSTRAIQVRINAPGSEWFEADLAAVAALPSSIGVRLPKATGAALVREVAGRLPGRGLHLLVESAIGIERAFEVAGAHPAVRSIGLGEADLRAELGVRTEEALAWARSRVVVAARAAGLPAPWMSVYPHLRDPDGLAASCRAGRDLGMVGRAAIHPEQLGVIAAAFRPSPEEVARAREIVARVGRAQADGSGTVVLDDGSFLDIAMVEQARRILELDGSEVDVSEPGEP